MTLVTVGVANGVLVAAVVAALAYTCLIPYRIDRRAQSSRRPIVLVAPRRRLVAAAAPGSEKATCDERS
jgi:hypothetical protein